MTRSIFSDYVTEVFDPTVHDYLREKDIPLKVLLIMDNAPAHPPNLMEELPGVHFHQGPLLATEYYASSPTYGPAGDSKLKKKKALH